MSNKPEPVSGSKSGTAATNQPTKGRSSSKKVTATMLAASLTLLSVRMVPNSGTAEAQSAAPGFVGTVFADTNGDGTGDTGIAGVTVELYDSTGATLLATTVTDADGLYFFEALQGGVDYIIRQVDAPGYVSVSDFDGGDPNEIAFTAAENAFAEGMDFTDENLGSIAGMVSEDTVGDGAGDTGIAGVTVELVDANGAVIATAVTDATGNYVFDNVAPGTYTVVETDSAGFVSVSDTDSGDNNVTDVVLADNEDRVGVDFVDTTPASISGVVQEDSTADGAGDTPMDGVTVQLLDAAGNPVLDSAGLAIVAITDATGAYTFTDVMPGDYTIMETNPSGFTSVSDSDGTNDDMTAVTVAPGDALTGIDFVDEQSLIVPINGSVAGAVLEDTTGDGNGDTPIASATVELVNANGVVVATASTDAAGGYWFGDVEPGDYIVRETDLSGYSSVSDTDGGDNNETAVTVGDDEDVTGIDFIDEQSAVTPGSITGTVLEDTTADGAGDTPMSGVTVKLLDAAGNPVLDGAGVAITATTDASGVYLFTDIAPGDYTVMETNPAGFTSVSDTDGTNDDMTAVTVGDGEDITGIDFVDDKDTITPGNGSITGTVLEDTTADGAGDTPMSGVTVKLLDAAGNPVLDGAGVAITATTDASGVYLFTDIAPGDYTVMETNPAGFTSVSDTDGTNDDMTAVTVGDGEDITGIDFVDDKDTITPGNGSIAGAVLEDTTGDGNGDTPIVGGTVELVDANGTVVATATTDANGYFWFGDVAPGDYSVRQTNLTGFTDVSDTDGGDNNETAVTVGDDEDVTGIDFIDEQSAVTPGSITGTVLEDTTADGAGDTPMSGVTVKLLDAAGNPVLDGAGVAITATTDASGVYLFTDIAPGDYTVMETNPAGFTSVSDTDGTNDDMTAVTVGDGEDITGIDFVDDKDTITPGNGSITGTVLEDTDGDGMGDQAITGVTVKLLDAAGGITATATTDANGDYVFSDVAPADYTVMETNPAGFTSVSDTDGTNDDMTAVTLAADEAIVDIDFVDEETVTTPGNGSIAGTVKSDTDANGTGDSALAGVTVSLFDAAGNLVGTTLTDGNGDYAFADVAPGTYTVAETDPTGYTSVSDTDGGDSNLTAVTVGADEHVVDVDYVDAPVPVVGPNSGSISGTVQEDTDGDSAGDTPIANVTVALLDSMGNPVLDGAGNPITTMTDASGNYMFDEVAPGSYKVVEMDPAGFTSVSDTDQGDNNITLVTVGDDEDVTGVNFTDEKAVTAAGNGSISGTVDEDIDDDGAGDSPLAGVTIKLLDAAGNPVLDGAGNAITTMTDGSGNYHFADVAPGTYTVMESTPIGFSSVSDTDGTNDDMTAVTVGADEHITGIDFTDEEIVVVGGNPGTITGSVAEDTDGNNTGDAALVGVTVKLVDVNGTVVDSTTTDANGIYSFTNVAPGTYTVVEVDPTGFTSVNDSDAGDNNVTTVTVGDGENITDIYFTDEATGGGGGTNPGTITGSVMEDTDGDDVGDDPIANVSVDLVDAAGTVVATAITDASGNYSFMNVAPGTYTVVEHDPTGFTSVNDSDAGDNNVTTVTVGDGEDITGIYFTDETTGNGGGGGTNPGTITGSVMEDTDGDDVGDDPIANVSVDLVDAAGTVVATAITDASGNYSFMNVAPGTYTVVEHDPTGFTSVNDSDAGDNNVTTVTVGDGEDITGIYFTDETTGNGGGGGTDPGTVSGTIHEDTDGNGTGDGPMSGVTVNLMDSAGNMVMTTVTDASGDFTFTNVAPGSYTVVESDPSGFTSVSDTDGGDNNRTDVTVASGQDVADINFTDEKTTDGGGGGTTTTATPDESLNNVAGTAVTVNPMDNDGSDLDPTTVQLIDPIDDQPTSTVTVNGEGVWTIDANTGRITFTPEAGFSADPTPIEYQVNVLGTTETRQSTVTITYGTNGNGNGGGTAPLAGNGSTTTAHNTPIVVSTAGMTSDVDGTVTGIELIDPATGQATTGAVTVSGVGAWVVVNGTNIQFTPIDGYTGTAQINYNAIDNDGNRSGVGTLSVDVAAKTSLPFTGASSNMLIMFGLALAAAGVAYVTGARRKMFF